MHTIFLADVGDGLCCALEDEFYEGIQVDWGSQQPVRRTISAWDRLDKVHVAADSFPVAFVLSHYHADHYNGLVSASLDPRYAGAWRSLTSAYGPGLPDIPHRNEFYFALFAVNRYTLGSGTEHMEFDFLRALGRLRGSDRFGYRRLYQGDNFYLGRSKIQCVWPPRHLGDARFRRKVEDALTSFGHALEVDQTLRRIHDEIREHPLPTALLGDGDLERPPSFYEGPRDPREIRSALYSRIDVTREAKDANHRLRDVANDLCLAFVYRDKLLFLGDVAAGRLSRVVDHLEARGSVDFEVMVAAHHGTSWSNALKRLRSGNTLVSSGPKLSPKYKPGYALISDRVLSTGLNGDVRVNF